MKSGAGGAAGSVRGTPSADIYFGWSGCFTNAQPGALPHAGCRQVTPDCPAPERRGGRLPPSTRVRPFPANERTNDSGVAPRQEGARPWRRGPLKGDLDWIRAQALSGTRPGATAHLLGARGDNPRHLAASPVFSGGAPGRGTDHPKFVRRHRTPVIASVARSCHPGGRSIRDELHAVRRRRCQGRRSRSGSARLHAGRGPSPSGGGPGLPRARVLLGEARPSEIPIRLPEPGAMPPQSGRGERFGAGPLWPPAGGGKVRCGARWSGSIF